MSVLFKYANHTFILTFRSILATVKPSTIAKTTTLHFSRVLKPSYQTSKKPNDPTLLSEPHFMWRQKCWIRPNPELSQISGPWVSFSTRWLVAKPPSLAGPKWLCSTKSYADSLNGQITCMMRILSLLLTSCYSLSQKIDSV